ncbi:MAG: 3-hydroxyacyl-CoA dehydrogenase [Actinobacteria bacterium]|nr:MAG: 3-hydroxyacyl-CoA dehydrogenase [Actinomycetota bacterium]TML85643.1 MAG: 3-hydroxyacyl-CoA dehydrogenase [Actinomycetota bacterium]
MPVTEFKLTRAGDVALVTIDNGEDWTKPTFFGREALESLDRLLGRLEGGDFRAAVVTGKPFVFAAGADITEFPEITRERAIEGARAGHELFGRLRALPFPTVAAINGACLGGGVELALHCTARTVSTAVRHFAFPEVFLGLFPAWGGTQLLPRLVGPETAIKVIVSNPLRQNRMLTAPQVAELGIADRLLEPGEFVDESLAFALELAKEPLDRLEPDWSNAETIFRRARTSVDDTVHGAAPAPYAALDLIEGAQHWTIEEGYEREQEAIGELLPGPQAQASLYAFQLVELRAKRHPARPTAPPIKVTKVGIVGAGLMARQVATLFLRRLEVPIVIRDVKQEIVDEALADIRADIDSQVAKGRYDEGKGRFLSSLVSGSTDYADFADCDLVLEAVFEELEVKKQVFAELELVVRDDCVLATNTSALSITDMAADLRRPERVTGMHFFNPVALMPLLEVVRAAETDDVALATVWDVGEKLRKRPILVNDAPGFVVNRVLTRMTRVIMDALEHGTPVEEVDQAVMSLGMPMAPSVLLQMVGPRVANHVLERMHDAFPERFLLSPALAAMADGGEPVVLEDAPRTGEQIVEEVLEAVADEIHLLLEEGVVAEAADVDTGLLLGAGWPLFLGGITKHLDQSGVSDRLFGHTFADMTVVAPA